MLLPTLLAAYVFGAAAIPGIDVDSPADDRELFRKLEEDYPGMAPHIARGVAVSIDGRIYRDDWQRELPEGAEIYLLPRIQGG